MIARRYLEQIPFPQPHPSIAPGRAITGKHAYLETNGDLVRTYINNTVLGTLSIVAHGAYTVDWGDGQTTGPYGFEGRPWPDGRILHDYMNVGTYNVVVTERWTAEWQLANETGVIRTIQTVGTISNFPVQQIQAVVAR